MDKKLLEGRYSEAVGCKLYGVNDLLDSDIDSMMRYRAHFFTWLIDMFLDKRVAFSYIRKLMYSDASVKSDKGDLRYVLKCAKPLFDVIGYKIPKEYDWFVKPDPITLEFSEALSGIYCGIPQYVGLSSKEVIDLIPPESLWVHLYSFIDMGAYNAMIKAYDYYIEQKRYDLKKDERTFNSMCEKDLAYKAKQGIAGVFNKDAIPDYVKDDIK